MLNLREIFDGRVNGGSFISIDTQVQVLLTGGKKNPHQGRIQKRTIGSSVMVFTNRATNAYEAMVMRRLSNEGKDPESFQLSARSWGLRETGTPFVRYNGNLYLEVIFLRAGETEYFLDNELIAMENIIGLKPVIHAEQGGLDNHVIIRTFAQESIIGVTIDHRRYVL